MSTLAETLGAVPTPTRLEDTVQKMIDQVTTTKPAGGLTGPTAPTMGGIPSISPDMAKALGLDSLSGILPTGPTGPVKPAGTALSDSAVKVSSTETVATPPLASELAASASASAEKTQAELATVKQDMARIEKKIEEGFAALMLKVAAQKQEPVVTEKPLAQKEFSDFLPTSAEIQSGMAGGRRRGKRSTRRSRRAKRRSSKKRPNNRK